MSRVTARFATSGMHCRSCAMLIDMTVAEVPGVESSESDAAAASTVVVFDDAVVGADAIEAAIRGAGYEASLLA